MVKLTLSVSCDWSSLVNDKYDWLTSMD